MEKDLVSIITPAYNAEQYLSMTIESVLAQTYQNWELLISNDCSTDNTQKIIESYMDKDNRIKTINAEKNGGVSAARNLALGQAAGKYIAFVDSDDLWHPQKLEKQIAFMQNNNYAFTYTSYQMVDETGQKLNRYIYSAEKMQHTDVIKNTLIGCLTVVVNREVVGDFAMPLIPHTEDTMAWYEILKRGFTAYGMPEVLSYYRVSTTSMTSNKVKMVKLQWDTYRSYCKYGIAKSSYYLCCYAFNAVKKVKSKSNI